MSADKPAKQTREWVVHTSQEADALFRAAADGKNGRHYTINVQNSAVIHSIPGLSHHLILKLSPTEAEAGHTPEWLMRLVNAQDADAAFAMLYIANCLAPPGPMPPQHFYGDYIELDDVIAKIGWKPRGPKEREEMRSRIYHFILFGERAHVRGERTGRPYLDQMTGKEVQMSVDSPLWKVFNQDHPEQPGLFPTLEIPTRVQIVISQEWAQLLASSATAQFLPFAEVLGTIPSSQPSGAWARVIGLALMNFWRRHPVEVLSATVQPTRTELIQRYTPKVWPVEDLLNTNKPARALTYWHGALQLLASRGILEPIGEVTMKPADHLSKLPRYNWGGEWLAGRADLHPGPQMREALEGRHRAIEAAKPKKRGRPPRAD